MKWVKEKPDAPGLYLVVFESETKSPAIPVILELKDEGEVLKCYLALTNIFLMDLSNFKEANSLFFGPIPLPSSIS